jgi:hypothetical protein
MDMQAIISQMAVLFILLGAGYIAGRIDLLSADGTRSLSKIVLYVTTPGTILSSVLDGDISATGGETAFFALMSLMAFLMYFAISIPAVRLLGGDRKDHGLYRYMASFSNSAFMGFPVTIAILGTASAFYVALYNIPFFMLSFSVGIIMVSGSGGKFDPKVLVNPALVAALLAIPLAITGYGAPAIAADTLRITGSMTTPAAMFVIGATLSRVSLRGLLSGWRLYPVTLLKLIVMPVAAWLVFRQLVADELMLGVLVVISGMPTAAAAAMLAIEYDGDEKIASSGIFLSTLLSGVTIPLIVYMLLM